MYTQTTNCIPAVKKKYIFNSYTNWQSMYMVHVPHHTWAPEFKCTQQRSLKTHCTLQHTVSATQMLGWHSAWSTHHKYYTGLALQATITLWHINWLSTNTVFRRSVFKAHLKYCCLLPFLHIVLQVTHDSSVLEGATFWPEPPPATAHTSPTSCILMDALCIIFLPVLKPVRFWVQKQHVPCLQGLPWFGERQ